MYILHIRSTLTPAMNYRKGTILGFAVHWEQQWDNGSYGALLNGLVDLEHVGRDEKDRGLGQIAAPWFSLRERWNANSLRGFDREAVARGRYRQGRVETRLSRVQCGKIIAKSNIVRQAWVSIQFEDKSDSTSSLLSRTHSGHQTKTKDQQIMMSEKVSRRVAGEERRRLIVSRIT